MRHETEVTKSCGNVFADLGLPDPEERLAKAMLSRHITHAIKAGGLTNAEAAGVLQTTPTEIVDVVRGRLSHISFDQLFRFLNALGMDVRITVSTASAGTGRGSVTAG